MGFSPQQLDDAYDAYRKDPSTVSDLFKLCIAVAHQQSSISTWNESRLSRDDIAQESAIAAFVALPTLKEGTIFSLWYLGVMRNKTNDALRKLYTATENALLANPPKDEPKHNSEWTRIAQAAGENLPLVRLLYQGLTVEEAANELGITKDAPHSHQGSGGHSMNNGTQRKFFLGMHDLTNCKEQNKADKLPPPSFSLQPSLSMGPKIIFDHAIGDPDALAIVSEWQPRFKVTWVNSIEALEAW
jgi:DNA-directed RNA polymerase specialized sigma24 family protein